MSTIKAQTEMLPIRSSLNVSQLPQHLIFPYPNKLSSHHKRRTSSIASAAAGKVDDSDASEDTDASRYSDDSNMVVDSDDAACANVGAACVNSFGPTKKPVRCSLCKGDGHNMIRCPHDNVLLRLSQNIEEIKTLLKTAKPMDAALIKNLSGLAEVRAPTGHSSTGQQIFEVDFSSQKSDVSDNHVAKSVTATVRSRPLPPSLFDSIPMGHPDDDDTYSRLPPSRSSSSSTSSSSFSSSSSSSSSSFKCKAGCRLFENKTPGPCYNAFYNRDPKNPRPNFGEHAAKTSHYCSCCWIPVCFLCFPGDYDGAIETLFCDLCKTLCVSRP